MMLSPFQEAIETIVASSAMAILKERNSKQQEADSSQSRWAKWRRGGIIGAAALTGGTLMAITGGIVSISEDYLVYFQHDAYNEIIFIISLHVL